MIWLLVACPHAPVNATVTGESMGGGLRVIVRCPTEAQHPACLSEAVAARTRVEQIHARATDWTAEGELHQLNAAAGGEPVAVSVDVVRMLYRAQDVSQATRGAFDVTIGALWGLWDFDAGVIPSSDDLAAKLALVDWRKLRVEPDHARLNEPGMAATLGGIAQGYAAQRALEQIPSKHEAIVDVSGDLCARGTWTVDVQDPRGPRGASVASVDLTSACLSTSGDYEKGFVRDGVRYHHILDARTGMPGAGAWSATVVASDGAVADALATALIVLGPDEEVVRALDAWALVIDANGQHVLGAHEGVVVRR